MLQVFEAAIDERGQVCLAEDIDLPVLRRAIVIVLDEPPASVRDTASLPELKYTKKQGQYLAFIHHYTLVHNRPPSESDIQAFFDVTPPSVHQMIVRLEEKALIKRVRGQARTIEVLVPPEQLPRLQ
jgi:DNA-binding MarR family transcriptional regulator